MWRMQILGNYADPHRHILSDAMLLTSLGGARQNNVCTVSLSFPHVYIFLSVLLSNALLAMSKSENVHVHVSHINGKYSMKTLEFSSKPVKINIIF